MVQGTIFAIFKLGCASQDQMWVWLAAALKKLEQKTLLQHATIETLVKYDDTSPYRSSFAIYFTGDERCLTAIQALRHMDSAYFGKDVTPLSELKATTTPASTAPASSRATSSPTLH